MKLYIVLFTFEFDIKFEYMKFDHVNFCTFEFLYLIYAFNYKCHFVYNDLNCKFKYIVNGYVVKKL